ncbi:hypothetical protein IE81DRAFT_349564 [Ceraceosorus guamensis]|uniref:Uncharacterized protein n=1 Tax=Ceraceosorus guamensis TaxID=1522189 RepID=A0A316VRV6_9BASI|nr:hypothetical protein IE81DRAFT_349564 [Ceraceosorus guamensis]PWN40090.1 hypothetical protein IE81DRAFT_349564 [Ceraceosorus guamensis]
MKDQLIKATDELREHLKRLSKICSASDESEVSSGCKDSEPGTASIVATGTGRRGQAREESSNKERENAQSKGCLANSSPSLASRVPWGKGPLFLGDLSFDDNSEEEEMSLQPDGESSNRHNVDWSSTPPASTLPASTAQTRAAED